MENKIVVTHAGHMHIILQNINIIKTRKLCYRKDDRAMRAMQLLVISQLQLQLQLAFFEHLINCNYNYFLGKDACSIIKIHVLFSRS